jgi:OFA family oxalate/formate antiporter-like MFS transporter
MSSVRLASESSHGRAIQLARGVVVMMAISSPQYVWTLFLRYFLHSAGGGAAAVQVTFSLLIVLQTVFPPAQRGLFELFAPGRLVASGAALTGLGWVLSAQVSGLIPLYLTYGVLCGIGTGIVYVGVVGLMARWFPDRRGFAIGVVAAGYGMGAMITTFPIAAMLGAYGAPATLTVFGILLGGIGVIAALGLREPRPGETPAAPSTTRARDVEPRAMLKTPIFRLMFAMMTMMSAGGLMVTSNFAWFAYDFRLADVRIWGMAALPLALTIDRLTNGLTRPFFGWVSDRIGRENTMGLAFLLEAAAILLLLEFRGDPVAFVALSGLVFFGWGEIFSLFPSTLTDTFGPRHATTNYSFLYVAQGLGSVLGGPLAAALRSAAGSWTPVFLLAAAMDVLTALLALFELKAMRQAYAAADAPSEEVRGPAA